MLKAASQRMNVRLRHVAQTVTDQKPMPARRRSTRKRAKNPSFG